MSAAFDTLNAARRLEDAGITRQHAEAIATVVREGQGDLVTTATLYRALWIQAAAIIAAIAALAGIATGLASLWSGH